MSPSYQELFRGTDSGFLQLEEEDRRKPRRSAENSPESGAHSPGYGQSFGIPKPSDYDGDAGGAVRLSVQGKQRAVRRFRAPESR